MRRRDDGGVAEQGSEGLCVAPPQDSDQGCVDAVDESADGGLGDLLPPLASMAAGFTGLHGKDSIEQHDSLGAPW
jgi:hypothetical protein